MGPLQVLGMSVDERMYDGQMCLAQKFANIVWQDEDLRITCG